MVYFTENDVYEVLTFEWQSGRDIRKKLEDRLGVSNLRWYDKLMYIAMLQSSGVSMARFYMTLASLEEQNLAIHNVVKKSIDDMEIKVYQYRKLPGGRKIVVKKIGRLELLFLPKPAFNVC
jgi:hypothetical protein